MNGEPGEGESDVDSMFSASDSENSGHVEDEEHPLSPASSVTHEYDECEVNPLSRASSVTHERDEWFRKRFGHSSSESCHKRIQPFMSSTFQVPHLGHRINRLR